MKRYKEIIGVVIIIYFILSIGTIFLIKRVDNGKGKEYKVEINRIYQGLVEDGSFTKPSLHGYNYVKSVSFLEVSTDEKSKVEAFYNGDNKYSSEIRPVYYEEKLLGFARFDYLEVNLNKEYIILTQVILTVILVLVIGLFLYIHNDILKPFNELSEMPYELSKGHLNYELKESKSRYFGKFVWGISLLGENLKHHKVKEIKLEKEKKLLLLSISHDIKTPLNAIKLYAKALDEDIYDDYKDKKKAIEQIGKKSLEIENFVKEIVKASSEDILEIEVKMGEFYLYELISKVEGAYIGKANLVMTNFIIGDYENKLIYGDIERAFEVIENIMENAFKYGDGREINISFYEEDYCQLVKIYNTGMGVSKNEFNHIFDSFFRGSNSKGKEGNGLGLYICRKIMEKMNGEVFAEYEEEGLSLVLVFQEAG